MKKSIIVFMSLLPVVGLGYGYRYRLFRLLSSIPLARKIAVRSVMRVPFIRKKFLGQMFHS
ncbi:sodium:proton antiporter [Halobacillus campisalis]|uniref:Uncharacterized protein n=1 Tax=Halobacillus campisalis TaxID=435909 RepID=A0ABW2K437_9BACI|nr:sodium:proton antiporter [Halobacillus campisalis]